MIDLRIYEHVKYLEQVTFTWIEYAFFDVQTRVFFTRDLISRILKFADLRLDDPTLDSRDSWLHSSRIPRILRENSGLLLYFANVAGLFSLYIIPLGFLRRDPLLGKFRDLWIPQDRFVVRFHGLRGLSVPEIVSWALDAVVARSINPPSLPAALTP